MRTENAIEIHGDLSQIVKLATEIERWPELLPHYRWVTLLDGGADRKVVEMAARRGRIPVRWQAIQEIRRDGPVPIIAYHHVGGVTRGMDVAWTFESRFDHVLVRIRHDFRLGWPIIGGAVANHIIGPHFVVPIADRTLDTIKRIVEQGEGSGRRQQQMPS